MMGGEVLAMECVTLCFLLQIWCCMLSGAQHKEEGIFKRDSCLCKQTVLHVHLLLFHSSTVLYSVILLFHSPCFNNALSSRSQGEGGLM